MTPAPDDPADDDPRVMAVAREYLAELEAGRSPDRRAYLARHPALADALAECFDGIDLAHAAGRALGRRAEPPELPPEPLGDFRIVREAGRGGMGVVYEAVQLSLGRRVALKVLPFAAALDAKQLQRFRTEAHAAAQLHHTNIVPVHAVGCERGTHFYAMQMIDGRPLDVFIRDLRGESQSSAGSNNRPHVTDDRRPTVADRRPTTVAATSRAGRGREAYRTAARIAVQVADALEYAHEAGVVHRDIKPGNLLLEARGHVWVTDFGLAQLSAEAGPTQTGDVVGTLRYMSPEQAAGRRWQVDHRTDVYSLGATLYELLTLSPAFPGQDRQELLHQLLFQEPRRPRLIDRGVPPELETVALKALAKAPEDRYASAGEMAADLRRFLDGLPVLARRPSLLDRGRKWVRRHPGPLAAAVLVLIGCTAGLAVAVALVERGHRQTADALLRERAQFQLARRAADDMIRIADEEAPDDMAQQGLRRRLLQAAIDYYQELIELRRDDPGGTAELEEAQRQVKAFLADLAVIQAAERHMLVLQRPVQDDLRLSADQRARLWAALRDIFERGPVRQGELPQLSASERAQQLLREMKGHEAAIAEILAPAQFARLRQIALQARGAQALQDPEVVKELRLTREQRAELREVVGGPGPRDHGPPGGRGGPPPGSPGGRGREADPERGLSQALALLTPEQQARWRVLTGERFAGLSQLRPGGGPGFDGGPPRRPGGGPPPPPPDEP
jgi:serine/threonine protein kinase